MASNPPLIDTIRRIAFRLSRPDILFWVLPLLMILLIAGTVSQKDLGLYVAQQKYFSSFIVWFGAIPFPGGYTLMGVFFINLLMKFLLFSEWAWHKSGIILTHFGVLLLILGGLFTALTESEGYLVIEQGETASVTESYHQRELRILKDGKSILVIPHQELKPGKVIEDSGLPFALYIDSYCFNCAIVTRPEIEQPGWTSPGKFMKLEDTTPLQQNEANMTGIEFSVDGKKYLTFDKFPKPPVITQGGEAYQILMGRAQQTLPFSVTLNQFERQLHPGTETARSYKSTITISDGQESWPATITMNEPLRYKGYTLYQSSFDLSGDKPFTVLSIVQNTGRLFPYISSLIMACGLILHILLRLKRREETL